MLLPVVLAGGVGSRLWPASRSLLPKQFLHFQQYDGSLFQNTLRRIEGIANISGPLVVCNEEHRFLVAEQLRDLGKKDSTILLEPIGRNTAPAVAIAALYAIQKDSESILLVLPADHMISNIGNFHAAVAKAKPLALKNHLITFGVVPSDPEVGYGYIKKGDAVASEEGFHVSEFVEKPDEETAKSYLADGGYFWNSGMFLFSAKSYLEELKNYAEDISDACKRAFEAIYKDEDFARLPEAEFSAIRGDSIDYAVMEKTARAAMVTLDAGWNDLGAWDALWEVKDKDSDGNVIVGDAITFEVSNTYIQADSRLVAAVGLDNTVIIETRDAILVADKNNAQSVKQIVEQIKENNRTESTSHSEVLRPWGSYESLMTRDGCQVKHIIVNPGEELSLQLHRYRAEHWTVIKGKGVVTCDENEITLEENQSTFIPLGSKHRLANPFDEVLEIIEVQVGDYLGEDDILRFEDKYGRIIKS